MVMGGAAFLISSLSSSALQAKRQAKTSSALAQAKEALIGYSLKVLVSKSDVACAATSNCRRPGDLPCPDTDNDGDAEGSCGNASGTTGQTSRLGRLPWKTLGLPDLRDGSGERLWYAVSNNFKNNTRATCNNAVHTGCLNSDTPGTINVLASDGSVEHNGSGASGAVAVIFSPGDVLQRQGALLSQNRTCTVGVDCDATEKCTSTPPTSSPRCDPTNYLDKVTAEDNADFLDSSSTNGFIQGEIKIADPTTNTSTVVLNDQLLVISQDNIMLPVQKRVAAEVKNCLTEYSSIPKNNSYLPWAAGDRIVVAGQATYPDTSDVEFGRIPDEPFSQTCSDTGGNTCGTTGGMTDNWGTTCTINNINWWVNWKEMVFYGLAHSLRPHDLTHSHSCPGSTCLTINPPSATNDKSFVIIVAGKILGTQTRSSDAEKNNISNYLEGTNLNGSPPFEQNSISATFNDVTVFK